jgi:hypothetical protein
MTTTQQTKSRADSDLLRGGFRGDVGPENDGACSSLTVNGGRWKLSRIAHFAQLEQRRKQAGNCRRCGKPNASGKACCEACRAYHARYKAGLKRQRLALPDGIARQFLQFRTELDKLRRIVLDLRGNWRIAYRRGYAAGAAGKRARLKRLAWSPPELSAEDKALVSHAFDHGED